MNLEPSLLEPFFLGAWSVIKIWWWLILPIFLYFPAKSLYLWWIRWEVWYKEQNWILLEIIPPAEILKPFRAMEDVFAGLWPIYDSANWRERWCEGMLPKFPYWFSFEIVSLEGEIHFYLRTLRESQKLVESVIQAHYPEAEIFEVSDYTQNVPQDIPNDDFNFYGEDFVFVREDAYPIKTYKFFEATTPEAVEAEKKIDPSYSMLEALAHLKKGEQYWFQIIIAPILDKDIPWITDGKKLVGKLAGRPEAKKEKSIIGETFGTLFWGAPKETKEARETIPLEFRLTPGEREVLKAIEEKISKWGFKVSLRSIYIYKKEAYFPPHAKIARSYFSHFATQNLNAIMYWLKTRTRIHYFFKKRRLFKRKRAIFRKYVNRFPALYPKMAGPGNLVLNCEELATIFHFPTKPTILPPGVPRIIARKGPPSVKIPTE
ncbi:MAG: hypothetical protein QMC93_02860 [Patescibacteria group bacterium]|nr:hypothetical protein [Patescibacteria group bacterium]